MLAELAGDLTPSLVELDMTVARWSNSDTGGCDTPRFIVPSRYPGGERRKKYTIVAKEDHHFSRRLGP